MQKRLLYGFHAVNARIRQNPNSIIEIYTAENRHDQRARDLYQLIEEKQLKMLPVDHARLDGLCGHQRHQGVIALIDPQKSYISLDDVLDNLEESAFLLILDGITDPHNLGACLRVADAMGVHAVIAPKDRAVGLNATVSKVACGAAESIPYITVTNLARTLRELKERGIWIVGTAADGDTDLHHFTHTDPIAWVLGAEGTGMRRLTREHCDMLVSIPMYGSVESLNVSVASGICLSETRRQRSSL